MTVKRGTGPTTKMMQHDDDMVLATWDTLIDLSKKWHVEPRIILTPQTLRGRLDVDAQAWLRLDNASPVCIGRYVIGYPNSRSYTFTASLFQSVIQLNRVVDQWGDAQLADRRGV